MNIKRINVLKNTDVLSEVIERGSAEVDRSFISSDDTPPLMTRSETETIAVLSTVARQLSVKNVLSSSLLFDVACVKSENNRSAGQEILVGEQ
jgi:hypothetical protein